MAEQPATIAREAKTLHQALKEVLKTKEPFGKDVEFQRKNLRKHYLNLLLAHPYEKESKDIETHLWMQTSHAFIAQYKSRIAALDRVLFQSPRQQQQSQSQQPPQRNDPHGPVEYRKLISRFRQFLAEEEKFWTLLVQRLYRTFGLTEARSMLMELGILSESEELATANTDGEESNHPNGRNHGRNHFQFPPENPDPSTHLPSKENRGSRIAILSKALICLGDIARYRELYNDSGGRPRAGHHDALVPGKRPRNRRGAEILPRARNYDRAQKCYEQARSLVPNDGNPFHQLAVLATYQKDSFLSMVHYYRALCVQHPYDTASDNLNIVLSKAYDQWKSRARRERERDQLMEPRPAPRLQIETFKDRIVVLHAMWRIGVESGLERMVHLSHKHDQLVRDDFLHLVSERLLPIDTITQTVVLSEAALFKHRMVRTNGSSKPPVALYWRILRHMLDLHMILLNVGKAELEVPPPSDVGEGDAALKITATFRRTLPALRIASKWLRANFKFVVQDQEYISFQEQEKAKGIKISKDTSKKLSGYSVVTINFWKTYVDFIAALEDVFPLTSLPPLTSPLDEDVDMHGFSPLKKLMGEPKDYDGSSDASQAKEKPHPNVEQLMRIFDILEDARLIAQLPDSPLTMRSDRVVFNTAQVEEIRPTSHSEGNKLFEEFSPTAPQSPQSPHPAEPLVSEDEGDGQPEPTSPTEEDVVRDAFRAFDNGDLDQEFEDDEFIVYPHRSVSLANKPVQSPRLVPAVPVKSAISSPMLSPRSPSYTQKTAVSSPKMHIGTTAEDLLNDVILGVNKNAESSVSSTRFLHNIWTASLEEQSLKFTASTSPPKAAYQSPRLHASVPLQHLPSSWSSYNGEPQILQSNMVGSPSGLSTYTQSQVSGLGLGENQHQRAASMTSVIHQNYLAPVNLNQTNDSFIYSSALPPQQPPLPTSRPTELYSSSSISPSLRDSNATVTSLGGIPPVGLVGLNPGLPTPTSINAAYLSSSQYSSPQYGQPTVQRHARQLSQFSLNNQRPYQHHPQHPNRSQTVGHPYSSDTPQA